MRDGSPLAGFTPCVSSRAARAAWRPPARMSARQTGSPPGSAGDSATFSARRCPKVEVLTDDDLTDVEAVDRTVRIEVLGGLRGPLSDREADRQGVVHPGSRPAALSFWSRSVSRRQGRLGPSHPCAGLPVEGDHRRRVLRRLPLAADIADDRPVPQVDTVVGADGDHRPSAGRGRSRRGAGGADLEFSRWTSAGRRLPVARPGAP